MRSPPLHLPADTSRFFLDICSGATSPLASAAVARGIPAIPIDILRNPAHDLLDVALFEQILRVAFSGRIAMGHGSPPCCEYSLLKLRPGGPPPCRSPQHLNGLPTNDAAANARVTQSRVILERTVAILYAVYQSGGHASLEQPRNSMSWSEPAAQGFMLDISADLVVVAACEFEMPFDKHWLFATSWRPLQSLQSVCPHAAGFHESFAGVRDASGDFLSRKTATFPNALAQRYVELIAPLFPGVVAPASEVTLEQATASVPVRPEASFPRACQDGGGIYSVPDWASPPPGTSDVFKTLRRDLMQLFASTKAPLRLRKQVAEGRAEPLFSESEVVSLRACWGSWFREQGFTQEVDWSVAKGQPYALNALEVLAQALQDRDVSLWPALRDGVPTGVERDIPPSHTFIPVPCSEEETDPEDFKICAGNWPGAEADPSLLEEMVQAELEAGYIEPVDSLDEARRRWPRVAVGKANIVKAPGRKPRLIVDPTVSGANPACVIPERFTLPGLSDIQAGFPIRACSEEVGGFSLDIAAAHKTVRVREAERGLLGIKVGDKYYFYKVAPFGGTFSAHWWQRLAGFFVRCCHKIVWVAHVMIMYVDDVLFWQAIAALDMSACLILSFCQTFNYPISWRKLQLGPTIEYIGWQIHSRAGAFKLPQVKVAKLLQAVQQVLHSNPCSCKDLEVLIGLLHWVLQLAPSLRPWLCTLYHDKARPLGTNFSLPQAALATDQVFPQCRNAIRVYPARD